MYKEKKKNFYIAVICFGLIALILWNFFYITWGLEEPGRQKEISVILYHAGSGGWESLLEGMKQAEDYFSININYVTLREDADGLEQIMTIEREIENGAEGIILAVCDYETIYPVLRQNNYAVPIVTVESGLNDASVPLVSGDNYAMGKRLAEEILEDYEKQDNLSVALVYNMLNRDSVQQREKGFLEALEGKAQILSFEDVLKGAEADVVAGLHKEVLLDLTQTADEKLAGAAIYGIGNTPSTVAALDSGRIEKLVFQNEFNMGYLGVETLLYQMESISRRETRAIEFFCVSKQELYGTQYEQLLFPIVK